MAYQLLKGKKGIIFGALDEKSIAWKTALACHAEGAELLLTNAPVAMRGVRDWEKLKEKRVSAQAPTHPPGKRGSL